MVEIYASMLALKYLGAKVNIDRFDTIVIEFNDGNIKKFQVNNNEIVETPNAIIVW